MSQQTKESQPRAAETEAGTATGQPKEVEVKDGQPLVPRPVKRYDIKKNPPRGAGRP